MLVLLILIQFIRPGRNLPAFKSTNDISSRYQVPDSVNKILIVACYDCHSDSTRYPWYSRIQPVYWWLNGHIQDGKRDLNFSQFAGYKIRKQLNAFKSISELVKNGEMPLSSYLWIHTDAKLSDGQKELISSWAMAQYDSIKLRYPKDSLVKK